MLCHMLAWSFTTCTKRTDPIDITFARPSVHIIPKDLGLTSNPNTVSNLLNAHFLEGGLINVHEVLTVDVVLSENIDVLATVDAAEPVGDTRLIPVHHRLFGIPVGLGELRFGRAGEDAVGGRAIVCGGHVAAVQRRRRVRRAGCEARHDAETGGSGVPEARSRR